MTIADITRALAAANCPKCGKRLFATNVAGYRQPVRLDVPDETLCHCNRPQPAGVPA